MLLRLLPLCFLVTITQGIWAQPNFPVYDIGTVTTTDAFGTVDSFNVLCQLRGIVHGIDFVGGPNQVQYVLADSTGAIWVQGQALGQGQQPYVVTEGDSVQVFGRIRQNNGLAFIAIPRTLFRSAGNALMDTTVVDTLTEDQEARLVRFNTVRLVDAAAWNPGGGGFIVAITNGSDTLDMRIDNDTDLFNQGPPLGFFDVVGLVGQNDNALPLDEGYFIQPRYSTDIVELPIPVVAFDPPSLTVWETAGSVSAEIVFLNPIADTVAVTVSLDTNSTATPGLEFTWTDTTVVFPANATQPISLPITLIDDGDIEGTESIILNLSNPTNGISLGASTLSISIRDNEYPSYAIGTVTSINPGNGVPDSIGVRAQLSGVLHGKDVQNPAAGGLQFALLDSTGGIEVFSAADSFGYVANEGDALTIKGTIVQFRGMTRILVDSLYYLSSGNALQSPDPITSLGEPIESDLVKMEYVKILGPWNNQGQANTFFSQATNGPDTFAVRVWRANNDLYQASQPEGWHTITALGGQFTTLQPPFLGGYYLAPRSLNDLEALPNPTVSFAVGADTVFEQEEVIRIPLTQVLGNPDVTELSISLITSLSTATEGTDFSFNNTTVSLSGIGNSSDTLEVSITNDNDIEGDEKFVLLIASATNQASIDIEAIEVIIKDDFTESIGPFLAQDQIRLYPNPALFQLNLESELPMQSLQVLDMQGRTVLRQALSGSKEAVTVSQLSKGLYLIQVQTRKGVWMQKWQKQ